MFKGSRQLSACHGLAVPRAVATIGCSTTIALSSITVSAHEGHADAIEELVVYGRSEQFIGAATSASEGMVGYDDIQLAPILRVGELVEAVPGMVATQHSGTGKANQYFLRGFNLDHGTDFSGFAEGVPINMRTHGHGQGYLDLNFLIPELVETTSFRKGPYSADVGDFSSAGSVNFRFYDELDQSMVSATAGGYDFYRTLAAGSFGTEDNVLTAALDYSMYGGPWEIDEDLKQAKFYVGHVGRIGGARSKITLQGYDGSWNSSDQVPLRAVEAGVIGPLGFIDPGLGGDSSRYSLTGALEFERWRASAYVIDYDFTLLSNFTYFLDDPLEGDQFEQRDRRQIYGLNIDGSKPGFPGTDIGELRWGANVRFDDIGEVGLYETLDGARTGTVRRDAVDELSVSAFVESAFSLTERLRTVVGLRAEYYDWDVRALRAENSGSGNDSLLSPKFNLAYRFSDSLEAYANWGQGFHSNDVRGTTISVDPGSGLAATPVDALVRSEGAEIGARYEVGDRFNISVVGFWLELDSELVFVGDAGGTEANDGSRRYGVETSAFWQASEWLALDLAYTSTDAEYVVDNGAGSRIPGAIESTLAFGMNAAWDKRLYASARLRYLGESPLVEDNSVRADESVLVNAGIGYRFEHFEVTLEAFNLFDSDDVDISYYYPSRLPGEPLAGVDDVHFHPLEPRTVRLTVSFMR